MKNRTMPWINMSWTTVQDVFIPQLLSYFMQTCCTTETIPSYSGVSLLFVQPIFFKSSTSHLTLFTVSPAKKGFIIFYC